MDFLPTLLHIINPAGNSNKFQTDGENIFSLLKGEQPEFERDLYWHFPHYRTGDVVPYTIIRSGNYKLIKYYDGKEPELYDLIKDVSESQNLAFQFPELVSELELKIENWINETGAVVPLKKTTNYSQIFDRDAG